MLLQTKASSGCHTLGVVTGFSGVCVNLDIDMTTEAIFHPEEPIRKSYDEFREQFDRDDMIMVRTPTNAQLNGNILNSQEQILAKH